MSTDAIVYGEIDGQRVVRRYASVGHEVATIRGSVALTPQPHMVCVRVSGEGAFPLVDRVCAAALTIRDGQLRHSVFLHDDGRILADVYVGNDDGAFLIAAEGITGAQLDAHLRQHAKGGEDVDVERLYETHTVLSLNGPFAWELLASIEGPEVIGFPYLSFYRPSADRIYFRAGKTGEYGYDLLIPRDQCAQMTSRIEEQGRAFDLGRVGIDALWHCGFENWFFNVHERAFGSLTPLELQLQWRVAEDKDFVGAQALRRRAEGGIKQRIVGLVCEQAVASGDGLLFQDRRIGEVLQAGESITTGYAIAVGLIDRAYAHSGIGRYVAKGQGAAVALKTVSPPFVHNRSLFINPQRHSYAERTEIAFPS